MSLITWSNNYSTGVKEIDDQHKNLIAIINELHDAMAAGHGKEAVGKCLDKLIDYTVYHFGTEERLMNTHGYSEHRLHEIEHKKLVKTASELHASFKTNPAGLTLKTMYFLKDWLNNHILGSDVKFGKFLNSRGVT